MNDSKIDSLSWPFYRYKLLMPEIDRGDVFQWLYLALAVRSNIEKGRPREEYSEKVAAEVHATIIRGLSFFDQSLLNKVRGEVEKNYIQNSENRPRIKEEAFKFLESCDDILLGNKEIRYIFQDAITGSVLPEFYESVELDELRIKDNRIETSIDPSKGIRNPSSKELSVALKRSIALKRFGNDAESTPLQNNEPEMDQNPEPDEDDPFYLCVEGWDSLSKDEEQDGIPKKELKDLRKNSVIYIGERDLFNLDVELIVEDRKPKAISPFGSNTNSWMTDCFMKGKNFNQALKEKMDSLCSENNRCMNNRGLNEKSEDGIISGLNHTRNLYEIVSKCNDDMLIELIISMEERYRRRDTAFFSESGKFLEYLLKQIRYERMKKNNREITGLEVYRIFIENRLGSTRVNYDKLLGAQIYDNWKKESEYPKSIFADVIIKTEFSNVIANDAEYVNDLFLIYDLRNKESHINRDYTSRRPRDVDLKRLERIVKPIVNFFW